MEHIELFFKSVFIDNMVFATFLGMCSYLAVSKKVSTAIGLGVAVTFVLGITVPLNWLLDQFVLQDGDFVNYFCLKSGNKSRTGGRLIIRGVGQSSIGGSLFSTIGVSFQHLPSIAFTHSAQSRKT